jgi:hypothetical protein
VLSYASAQAFSDGFAPAIGVSAALALVGVVAAMALPGRHRTTEVGRRVQALETEGGG